MFVTRAHSATEIVGVVSFLVASTFAERYPVPVEGADANGVSLGFVFAVAALVLFGWAPATFIYASAPTLVAVIERRSPIRAIFNCGVFGIGGGLAGIALPHVAGSGATGAGVEVAATAAILYVSNMLLVTAAIALSGSPLGYPKLIRSNVRWTAIPFTLMASTGLMLVVLWQRTPWLFAALAGPLVAISLYQRTTHKALSAMRLALTDPLTGLGNHRHFQERLQRELAKAEAEVGIVSLCLLDVDSFKQINDRHGHQAGDRILSQVSARLRQGGEAFRLGGDEFAVLLPSLDAAAATEVARAIVERIGEADVRPVEGISVSAGVASFPQHSRERDSLIRLADRALYRAKEQGKNRVHLADATELEPAEPRRPATPANGAVRFGSVSTLARAVDERDAYAGSHSERVAALAARIGEQLALTHDEVELARVAGRLHDLGKLAVPREILHKGGPLSAAERHVLERHTEIGSRMVESIGLGAAAPWVLHHHERWDGAGYPAGLHGEEIPLGARIIFVAGAFDSMTSVTAYRAAMTRAEALDEVQAAAGTQFDPTVVDALAATLGSSR
ncbi:MAG: bifunctional diguanylate cyclase/phosphohydrolase [Caldimonas sp.]